MKTKKVTLHCNGMMKMKTIVLLFICLMSANANAQLQGQLLIDSLIKILPAAKNDSNKVILLSNICFNFYSVNPDSGIEYGKQAVKLAEEINWKKGVALAENKIGINYCFGKSDYPNALECYLKSLKINQGLGSKKDIAYNLNNIGIIYIYQNDFAKALEYFFQSKELNEQLGDNVQLASTLGYIGNVFQSKGDYDKALKYYLNALEVNQKIGEKIYIAENMENISTIYKEQGDFLKAIDFGFNALGMFIQLQNQKGIATIQNNIGGIYLSIALNNDKADLQKLFGGNQNKALMAAKNYTDSALVIFKESDDLNSTFQAFEQLSEIFYKLGNYKEAMDSYKNYSALKDSVFNMEKDQKLTQTAMQYDFDKKESALKAEQDKQDIIQRNIRNSTIGGAAFLMVLLLLLFNRYQYKQKANKKLEDAYQNLQHTQKQLIESEKLAAIGTMATRMSHEIQNPLNFVNNFSELSVDLISELSHAKNEKEIKEVTDKLKENLERINFHGSRAANIITQLQEHTRTGKVADFFEES